MYDPHHSFTISVFSTHSSLPSIDDSAAHISEETSGAARAAPIAVLVGVGATASLGWLLYIAASFAAASIPDLLASPLPLPMGQLFLDVLGKRGMLAIWSLIIVVQYVTGSAQGVDASRVVFAFARDIALPGSRWWKPVLQDASERVLADHGALRNLWAARLLGDRAIFARRVRLTIFQDHDFLAACL